MATLYPSTMPVAVIKDSGRGGERRVYEALEKLDDDYTVFYRVRWHHRDNRGARDGEADFIVAHPNRGYLVLEVKGGGISYDAATQQWSSRDRFSQVHAIGDPVDQALRTEHWLLGQLKMTPSLAGAWLTKGHGVIFPDTRVGNIRLRADLSRELVIDADDLDDPRAAVDRIFTHYAPIDGDPVFGRSAMSVMTSMLANSFELRTPLGLELDRDADQLITLTEQQFHLLDWLGDRPRAAVQGCAGSGKTMLALEKARRLAGQGLDVLLTCFNKPLSQYLRLHAGESLTVFNFHELCGQVLDAAGVAVERGSDLQAFYGDVLPALTLDAIDESGIKFDAIIVDEGQDFASSWWVVLEALLSDAEQSPFFVFSDDNQNLYGQETDLHGLIPGQPFALTRNCRNTRNIHEFTAAYHHDAGHLDCSGPEGSPVEMLSYSDDRQLLDQVRRLLHRLVVEENINTRDIVILTPRSQKRTAFKHGSTLGRFTFVEDRTDDSSTIQVTSVHKFKGLERKVVILVEIDDQARGEREVLLYVGGSRAQVLLVVVARGKL